MELMPCPLRLMHCAGCDTQTQLVMLISGDPVLPVAVPHSHEGHRSLHRTCSQVAIIWSTTESGGGGVKGLTTDLGFVTWWWTWESTRPHLLSPATLDNNSASWMFAVKFIFYVPVNQQGDSSRLQLPEKFRIWPIRDSSHVWLWIFKPPVHDFCR